MSASPLFREHTLSMRKLLFVALAGLTALVGCGGVNNDPGIPVKNPAVKALFTTQPQAATAGEALAAFQVVFQDKDGKTVEESGGAPVALTLVAGPQGATLGGTTQASLEKGIAIFTGVTFTQAGEGYIVEAQRKGITVRSTPFAIRHAAAARLAVTAQTVEVEAGGVFPAFQVSVRDAFGNAVVNGPAGEVTAALVGNPTALGGTTTVALNQGVATFSELMVDVAGEYELAFSVGGLTSVTTAVRVAHGPAKSLTFTTQPSGVAAGEAMASVAVTLYDHKGNITTRGNGEVTLVLASNPGGATLGGALTAPVVNGVATFSGLTLEKVGAGYTLRASSGALAEATSNGFNVTPGSPAKLAFLTEPTSAVAGVALSPAVRVAIQDSFGNTVTSSTRAVLVSLNDNPGSAVLSGTRTVNAEAGIVTFSTLSLNKAASGYTLTATTPNTPVLAPAFSAAFAITPAAPAKLAWATQPTNVVAGATLSPAVRVNLLDAFDNLTTSTNSVTVALASNPGSSTLSGAATVNAESGVATFSTLSLNKVGTGYTLAASSAGTPGATSTAFAVSPGAPAELRYFTQPKNQLAGVELGVQVEVLDAHANRATNANLFVRIAFGNNPTGASFIGVVFEETVNGIASFNDTTIFKAGNGYTLVASTLNISGSITSNAFNVTAEAPDKLVFSTQPGSGTTVEALAPAPVVTMQDRYDNTATQFTGPVTLALQTNPSAATLSGTLTVNAVAGVASGFSVIVSKAGTGYTLRASADAAILTAESNAFDVAPPMWLLYTNPTVGKVRLMRNDAQSTATTLVLDVVATENLTGYGLGFNLPVDGSRVQLAQVGLTPGAILNPGSNPVAARAALPTTGPLAGVLTTVLSQKAFGSGAVSTDAAIPAGSVLYSLRLERKGISPGVVFDGSGALPVAFNGAMRDSQGSDVVARAGFGIGRLELALVP